MAEIAMQYSEDSFSEIIVSFANNVHTPEGGMHEEGLKRALTTVLNAYGKKANIFKGEEYGGGGFRSRTLCRQTSRDRA